MIIVKNQKLPIFDGILSFCFTDEPELIQPYYKADVFEDVETYHGFATIINFKGKVTYVLGIVDKLGRKQSIGVITHEAVHITQFICDHIGYEAKNESDEIYSHLAGYITDEYIKFLKSIDKFSLFV